MTPYREQGLRDPGYDELTPHHRVGLPCPVPGWIETFFVKPLVGQTWWCHCGQAWVWSVFWSRTHGGRILYWDRLT